MQHRPHPLGFCCVLVCQQMARRQLQIDRALPVPCFVSVHLERVARVDAIILTLMPENDDERNASINVIRPAIN